MVIRRGEVWWADLGEPFRSETGYRRPIVVIQANFLNGSGLRTVLVVPLTTNLRWADHPGNARFETTDTGLPKTSVANCTQITNLDLARFDERIGELPDRAMAKIDYDIVTVMGL